MNEKQVKLNEFMIAFEKKSPLILISATVVKVTFMKKHPEASVLSILKLAYPLSMHKAALACEAFHIELAWHRLYYINYTRQFCFKYTYLYTVTGMESELFLSLSFSLLSLLVSLLWL